MTQSAQILAHLNRGQSIDSMTALREYGCNRLAARILELRAAGVAIETEMRKVQTRSGSATVAVYRLM